MNSRLHPNPPQPQKWLKYQLLAAFGLTDEAYLRENIHRRPWARRNDLVAEVRRELEVLLATGGEASRQLFVVKFVPRHQTMWLPNVRVESLADMPALERAVRDHVPGEYDEIWYCRTVVSPGHFSVAGRLLVSRWGGPEAQKIEQVWRCSPRLIEQLEPQFPFPFVRAARRGWRWAPEVQEIHRPEGAPESLELLRRQFAYALRLLDGVRERMEFFTDHLSSLGLEACSLEYKVEGDRLRIIDWDTGNDSLALAPML